jgi:hypothetical protein
MTEIIKIPKREKKTTKFTIRFSKGERAKLDRFCASRNTTLTALIRFSLETVMKKAK